jgi:hypothetical protein
MASNPHGCRCSFSWRRSERDALRQQGSRAERTSPPAGELAGTWDFKWSQGRCIRVALQDGPIPNKERVIANVQRIAQLWLRHPEEPEHRISLRLDFDAEPFPAPRAPETHGSISPAEPAARSYDVLISLAPLPVFEPETPGDPKVVIEAATSQLGSYALRSDYGVPTTYLGPPAGYGDAERPASERLTQYFDSRLFEFVVAHEFGHILGLAHEHQNPNLRLKWLDNDQIRAVMRSAWQLPDGHELLSDDYIDSEIKLPWPGSARFSDWRPASESVPLKDSIMAHALFRRFLRPNPKLASSAKRAASGSDDELVAPTAEDLAQLRRMYPYRAKAAESQRSPRKARALTGNGKAVAPARP